MNGFAVMNELHLPALISSVLFSAIAAWSVFMPLFSVEGEPPSSSDPELNSTLDSIVDLEKEYKAGRLNQAEYAAKLLLLRQRAAELMLEARRGRRV